MALIKCYECGKEISDKAPSCPHCGAPQLVSKNKEVKAKKTINFSKYLKPIPLGLGLILIPLIGAAAIPLYQANGNLKSVVWRFKNEDFIKSRCAFRHLEKSSLPKNCRSLLYKLGEKAEKVSFFSHSACMTRKKYESPKVYNTCIDKWDKVYARRQRIKKKDVFYHKGQMYRASKSCPEGKQFIWDVKKGFLSKDKVYEVGCLSAYELQSLKDARNKGGGSGWKVPNNQAQQNRMRIQTNEYKRYLDNYSKDMGW